MIEEQAQVIEIKGDELILQAQTQSACGSCSARKGCGTSVLSKVVGRKFTHFQAKNTVNAVVGDTVVVGIAEDALLKGSVVIYAVPILAMMMIALLADLSLDAAIEQRDLLIAFCAISGLILGSLLSKRYFQSKSSKHQFSPVVIRKII